MQSATGSKLPKSSLASSPILLWLSHNIIQTVSGVATSAFAVGVNQMTCLGRRSSDERGSPHGAHSRPLLTNTNTCQAIHFLTIHIHFIKPARFSAVGRGRFGRAVQASGIPPWRRQPRLLRRPQPGGVAGESEGATPRPVRRPGGTGGRGAEEAHGARRVEVDSVRPGVNTLLFPPFRKLGETRGRGGGEIVSPVRCEGALFSFSLQKTRLAGRRPCPARCECAPFSSFMNQKRRSERIYLLRCEWASLFFLFQDQE